MIYREDDLLFCELDEDQQEIRFTGLVFSSQLALANKTIDYAVCPSRFQLHEVREHA
jgi:hypothetical protein